MPYWVTSLLFAVLVVTIPFTMILRILLQLPKANALSHRRWPSILNLTLIGAITAYVTLFIRSAYYVRGSSPLSMLLQFTIAAVAYAFGLVLILRQFSGVYPEYIVTTGRAGLGIRKLAYRNMTELEEVWRGHGETQLRIHTVYGNNFLFNLPTSAVAILHERMRLAQPPE